MYPRIYLYVPIKINLSRSSCSRWADIYMQLCHLDVHACAPSLSIGEAAPTTPVHNFSNLDGMATIRTTGIIPPSVDAINKCTLTGLQNK